MRPFSPSANSSNHVLRHKVFFFVVSNSVFIADFKSDGGQTLNFGHFCLQVKNQNGRHRIRVKDVVRGIIHLKTYNMHTSSVIACNTRKSITL